MVKKPRYRVKNRAGRLASKTFYATWDGAQRAISRLNVRHGVARGSWEFYAVRVAA